MAPLADGVDGPGELVGEVDSQARSLALVQVAGRSKVDLGTRVKANPHVLRRRQRLSRRFPNSERSSRVLVSSGASPNRLHGGVI